MSPKKDDYQSAMKFIYDREHFGIKLGLKNISYFLEHIGRPQDRFRSIHIAGTNGKGSTASFIATIMRKAGYKTGLFTSPHLVDFRERITVNGVQIGKKFIGDFIRRYRRIIDSDMITFFEVCTALAFSYFAAQKVDLAVVETGLGGRLDATSTLKPILSIITDISYDHTNILGNTLRKIAYEKAGIIKRNTPVLVGPMKPEPRNEIKRISASRKAPYEYLRPKVFSTNGNFQFDFNDDEFSASYLKVSLPGRHQIRNASVAIKAVSILRRYGFKVQKGNIRDGLKHTEWPGRFQILKSQKKASIVLDVGHNESGVKAMVDCFKEIFPERKADLIIGFVRFKNLYKTIRHLIPITRSVEITRLDTHRSTDPEDIAELFPRNRFPVSVSDSLKESASRIIKSAQKDDIIIVCGSHFAVGEFLENRNKIL
jgi:dihydrofolate synthase/folylpolyglutamate synthase